ncbi:hypothetical protein [Lentilactobacillus kosonis]|uniref:Uncharacterized protein n=1 Tax=Lentilactobacillus kosonis TaxID=2810561 RepID=A0A401FQ03_9LACO|nr:hypothetical protein [Lentilactobacillus kosonis]GAY74416.1 hypothetical protein NBRC111893_2562 [Lentilactobacillus kosonis]
MNKKRATIIFDEDVSDQTSSVRKPVADSVTFDSTLRIDNHLANYKFNPNKPGIFQWQSVDDVFLMVVD